MTSPETVNRLIDAAAELLAEWEERDQMDTGDAVELIEWLASLDHLKTN